MKSNIKKLPEAELQVMLAVWKCDAAFSASEVLRILEKNYVLPTLMTVLSRLIKKGYLSLEKQGRNNVYRALVSEQEYRQLESRSLLQTLFQDSVKNFVTALYDGKELGQDEVAELKSFLDGLENKRGS